VRVERLAAAEVGLLARIDRSEHVETQYTVRDGVLVEAPVVMEDIPPWHDGTGEHSIAEKIEFSAPILAAGAVLLGAFTDARDLAGLAIVDPTFEPSLAWLALLHVSRPHRRHGAASALWRSSAELAVAGGAEEMYVSATPTGSAVGFYLSRGCRLAEPVHPALFEREPDDIHLVGPLRPGG